VIPDPQWRLQDFARLREFCLVWAPECRQDPKHLQLSIWQSIIAREFDREGELQDDGERCSGAGLVRLVNGSEKVLFLPGRKLEEYLNILVLDTVNTGAGQLGAYLDQFADAIIVSRRGILKYASDHALPYPSWWEPNATNHFAPPIVDANSSESAKTKPIYRTGVAGRPSSRDLARQEMQRRAEEGRLHSSLAGETRELCAWLQQEHPEAPQLTPKALENSLRGDYRTLKRSSNLSP
jgi:hypothetical protein